MVNHSIRHVFFVFSSYIEKEKLLRKDLEMGDAVDLEDNVALIQKGIICISVVCSFHIFVTKTVVCLNKPTL